MFSKPIFGSSQTIWTLLGKVLIFDMIWDLQANPIRSPFRLNNCKMIYIALSQWGSSFVLTWKPFEMQNAFCKGVPRILFSKSISCSPQNTGTLLGKVLIFNMHWNENTGQSYLDFFQAHQPKRIYIELSHKGEFFCYKKKKQLKCRKMFFGKKRAVIWKWFSIFLFIKKGHFLKLLSIRGALKKIKLFF